MIPEYITVVLSQRRKLNARQVKDNRISNRFPCIARNGPDDKQANHAQAQKHPEQIGAHERFLIKIPVCILPGKRQPVHQVRKQRAAPDPVLHMGHINKLVHKRVEAGERLLFLLDKVLPVQIISRQHSVVEKRGDEKGKQSGEKPRLKALREEDKGNSEIGDPANERMDRAGRTFAQPLLLPAADDIGQLHHQQKKKDIKETLRLAAHPVHIEGPHGKQYNENIEPLQKKAVSNRRPEIPVHSPFHRQEKDKVSFPEERAHRAHR